MINKGSTVEVLTFGFVTFEDVIDPDTYGDGRFVTVRSRNGRTSVVEVERVTPF